MKKRFKPFVRYIRCDWGEDINQGIQDTFAELGFTLYSNPVEEGGVFISNFPLTEGWLQCNHQKFGIPLKLMRGYKPEGNEELDVIW